MLTFFCILIVLAVGYAHHREGLFTALTMLVNVFLAGVLAFGFWEPIANFLEQPFAGSFVGGSEDFLVLTILFCVFLGLLRLATNTIAFKRFELEPNQDRIGAALIGLFTGYLVAGFLASVLQTLPWHENFMDFQPQKDNQGALRTYLPPDRVWLAVMRHAGANSLAWREVNPGADNNYERYRTFDPHGTFEIRYLRYRRYGDARDQFPYQGEFDLELLRK